jgi:hypothetical protein
VRAKKIVTTVKIISPQEVVPIKGEEFKPFLAEKPPFAVLLNGIGGGYQAVAA